MLVSAIRGNPLMWTSSHHSQEVSEKDPAVKNDRSVLDRGYRII